jgi:hypothetical protein
LSDKEAGITISKEEKAAVSQGIIDNALKMMERVITEKSAKKRARSWSKPHNQSKTAITSDTILFNILTRVQQLPARPRDFRLNLSDEEKEVGGPELSDILRSMVRKNLLDPKRDDFPFPKGRPGSDLAEERRGRFSYYEQSKIKAILDEIIKDPEVVRSIDNEILKNPLLYRSLKYYFETHFYQMRENETAFLNTQKPAIMKYGLAQRKKEELDSSWTHAKYLTSDKIKKLAEHYALYTIRTFKEDGKTILYLIAGLFFFFNLIHQKIQQQDPNSL